MTFLVRLKALSADELQFPEAGMLCGSGPSASPTLESSRQSRRQAAIVKTEEVAQAIPGLVAGDKVTTLTEKSSYEVLKYEVIDDAAVTELVEKLPEAKRAEATELLASTRDKSKQQALAAMVIFPAIMLVCYIVLIMYFKSKGGYKAVELDSSDK